MYRHSGGFFVGGDDRNVDFFSGKLDRGNPCVSSRLFTDEPERVRIYGHNGEVEGGYAVFPRKYFDEIFLLLLPKLLQPFFLLIIIEGDHKRKEV